VRISKRKWVPGSSRFDVAFSWQVDPLGVDRHGSWLGARRGSPVRQPDGRTEPQVHDAVWLVVEGASWLTAFWFTSDTDLTIDVCTPPVLDDDTWSFADLELDLFRAADGRAGIVDQDEFAVLAASGTLSVSEVEAAEATARALLPLVERRSAPFDDTALAWLEVLRAQEG
jgi:predicted RNA-binding protein associated with RNAse of E/G family